MRLLTDLRLWLTHEVSNRRSLEPHPERAKIVHEVLDPASLRTWVDEMHTHARELPQHHYRSLYAELDEAEASDESGARPKDGHQAYLPRHVNVSLLQSTITECLLKRADDLLEKLPNGHDSFADYVRREGEPFETFGPCDPGWIESVVAKGIRYFEGRAPFPEGRAPNFPLARDARVVVVGDWGTGLKGAQDVATQMKAKIDEAKGRDVHVVHLGDVYYSGWKEEYESRFIPFWPVRERTDGVYSWALNGNHDMYSGGRGYFKFLLRDERFVPQNRSSFFRLGNEDWQLLGLDSAYHDADLAGGQADWVADRLADSKRTMLLTHHQPFTSFEDDFKEPKMVAKLKAAIGDRRIDAWLWGHEHMCCVYRDDLQPYLRFGSCIGHGGVPVLAQTWRRPDVQEQFDEFDDHAGEHWQRCGFAVLDFNGPDVTIQYWNQYGDRSWEPLGF
jgi:hypothetical protein